MSKQKVYGVILFLAVGAWLTDRFVLNGGVSAPAAADASTLSVAHAEPSQAPATSAAAKSPDSLGDRLARYAQAHGASKSVVLDAFKPPASWLTAPPPAPIPVAAVVTMDVEKFRRDHKLNAVIRSTEGDSIIIDGRVVRLGEQVGGMKLAEISPTSATFRNESAMIVLKLSNSIDANGAGGRNK